MLLTVSPLPDEVAVESVTPVSSLVTAHDCAFATLQFRTVEPPRCRSDGVAVKLLYVIDGYKQTEEPAEQNDGDEQVVTDEVWHELFVYWIVCPEQVYVGVQ